MGTLGKIALIITPWLLVIGLMTYLAQGQFYAPDGSALLISLSSFSGVQAIRDFRETSVGWGTQIETAFGEVTDPISFFNAIGTFFQTLGDVIKTFITILTIPFQLIGWLFEHIFSGASIPEQEASSSSGLLARFMC